MMMLFVFVFLGTGVVVNRIVLAMKRVDQRTAGDPSLAETNRNRMGTGESNHDQQESTGEAMILAFK
jgi:hypothetical protein